MGKKVVRKKIFCDVLVLNANNKQDQSTNSTEGTKLIYFKLQSLIKASANARPLPSCKQVRTMCLLTGNLDSLCDASASAATRNNFVKRFIKSAKTSLNTSKVKSCAPKRAHVKRCCEEGVKVIRNPTNLILQT